MPRDGSGADVETSDFDSLLREKMLERNLDSEIISYVIASSTKLHRGYDVDDPYDIAILNNKIEHIAQAADDLGTIDPETHSKQLRAFVTLLSTKH